MTFTLWLFNIAMENGPFIDDFPINTSIYKGFSMAMLNNQMVLYVCAVRSIKTPCLLKGFQNEEYKPGIPRDIKRISCLFWRAYLG
jgi:hypothetical protein